MDARQRFLITPFPNSPAPAGATIPFVVPTAPVPPPTVTVPAAAHASRLAAAGSDASRTILVVAPPGAGKTSFQVALGVGHTRPAHSQSCEKLVTVTPDERTLVTMRPVVARLLDKGEFPEATQVQNGLSYCVWVPDRGGGDDSPYFLEAVDTRGGDLHDMPDPSNDDGSQLFHRLVGAHGLLLLVDPKNLGEGARAIEYVVEGCVKRLQAWMVAEARARGERPSPHIPKNVSVVVSQVDQLVEEDDQGVLRFKRRPLVLRPGEGGNADVELVDLPSDGMLDLRPHHVRTYLMTYCGEPGRRLVESLERAFDHVGYFAMSAVGLAREQGRCVPNVRVKDGRCVLRDPRALEPIGLLEPLAYAIDPTSLAVDPLRAPLESLVLRSTERISPVPHFPPPPGGGGAGGEALAPARGRQATAVIVAVALLVVALAAVALILALRGGAS